MPAPPKGLFHVENGRLKRRGYPDFRPEPWQRPKRSTQHRHLPWKVSYSVHGRRKRNFFKTEEDALRFIAKESNHRHFEGSSTVLLGDELRVDAVRAAQLLQGRATLEQAAAFWLEHGAPKAPIRVKDLVAEFRAADTKRGGPRSKNSLKEIRTKLEIRFCAAFGNRWVHELALSDEVARWFTRMGFRGNTRKGWHRMLGALFSYAKKHKHIPPTLNPLETVEPGRGRPGEVPVFTVEEAEALLRHAENGEDEKLHLLIPYLAIGLFAGLRPDELAELTWDDVWKTPGHIEVRPRPHARPSGRARFIKIQPNLAAWLAPYRKCTERVLPSASTVARLRRILRAKIGHDEWPQDVMRHSFGSYRLAITKNKPALAEEMDNSVAVIDLHYRRPIPQPTARRYWAIRPRGSTRKEGKAAHRCRSFLQ